MLRLPLMVALAEIRPFRNRAARPSDERVNATWVRSGLRVGLELRDGRPLVLEPEVRSRTLSLLPSWPRVMFRLEEFFEIVTIRAGPD